MVCPALYWIRVGSTMVLLAFMATNTKLPPSSSAAIAVVGMMAETRSTRLRSRAITLLCIFHPPLISQYRQFQSRYRILSHGVQLSLQAVSTRMANESTFLRCSGVIFWVLNSAF